MGSLHQFVVFLVRANPNPFNAAVNFVPQCAVMIAHADGKSFAAPAWLFEIERWVTRVVAPGPVIF
jgi:hypothetical protein